jgi:hypothetical protein
MSSSDCSVVERRIVAPLFDQHACMPRRGAVAAEQLADFVVGQADTTCARYIAVCRAKATSAERATAGATR